MRLEVPQPILDFADMARLREIEKHTSAKFKSYELNITYPVSWGDEGVEAKLASLCAESVDALKSGHNILIISDRQMDRDFVAIPAVLALSAIHQHLVREGLRTTAGLVVETGSAREVHHFAVRDGYGAEAVHPYLAMETLAELHATLPGQLSAEKAIYNYVKAIGKGVFCMRFKAITDLVTTRCFMCQSSNAAARNCLMYSKTNSVTARKRCSYLSNSCLYEFDCVRFKQPTCTRQRLCLTAFSALCAYSLVHSQMSLL